uniref:Uncharacterized protein n=1 Tax=Octopus bimaculoides TaxID=37653 RepID=A0A0L8I7Z2_OCTBM
MFKKNVFLDRSDELKEIHILNLVFTYMNIRGGRKLVTSSITDLDSYALWL